MTSVEHTKIASVYQKVLITKFNKKLNDKF